MQSIVHEQYAPAALPAGLNVNLKMMTRAREQCQYLCVSSHPDAKAPSPRVITGAFKKWMAPVENGKVQGPNVYYVPEWGLTGFWHDIVMAYNHATGALLDQEPPQVNFISLENHTGVGQTLYNSELQRYENYTKTKPKPTTMSPEWILWWAQVCGAATVTFPTGKSKTSKTTGRARGHAQPKSLIERYLEVSQENEGKDDKEKKVLNISGIKENGFGVVRSNMVLNARPGQASSGRTKLRSISQLPYIQCDNLKAWKIAMNFIRDDSGANGGITSKQIAEFTRDFEMALEQRPQQTRVVVGVAPPRGGQRVTHEQIREQSLRAVRVASQQQQRTVPALGMAGVPSGFGVQPQEIRVSSPTAGGFQ